MKNLFHDSWIKAPLKGNFIVALRHTFLPSNSLFAVLTSARLPFPLRSRIAEEDGEFIADYWRRLCTNVYLPLYFRAVYFKFAFHKACINLKEF